MNERVRSSHFRPLPFLRQQSAWEYLEFATCGVIRGAKTTEQTMPELIRDAQALAPWCNTK